MIYLNQVDPNVGGWSIVCDGHCGWLPTLAGAGRFERQFYFLSTSLFQGSSGRVLAFGDNGYGQLGTGDTTTRHLEIAFRSDLFESGAHRRWWGEHCL